MTIKRDDMAVDRPFKVDFVCIFEAIANADGLFNAIIAAKILCNAMYANHYLTEHEWECIMAALDPQL